MVQKSHLTITQAGLTSLVVMMIGQLVAFVPSLAPLQQLLISIAATAVSLGFLVANAIHKMADAKTAAAAVAAPAAVAQPVPAVAPSAVVVPPAVGNAPTA